jgi:hypothetical protein
MSEKFTFLISNAAIVGVSLIDIQLIIQIICHLSIAVVTVYSIIKHKRKNDRNNPYKDGY